MAALEAVGLADRAGLKPHQLSGGERQRVAIARVMASQPRIVFADEPTGALDLNAGQVVLDWLRRLTEQGTTVVMVTHNVEAAARADAVAVMSGAGWSPGPIPVTPPASPSWSTPPAGPAARPPRLHRPATEHAEK